MSDGARTSLRRLRMGFQTLLRPRKPLGFFIPYRFAGEACRTAEQTVYRQVAARLEVYLEEFTDILEGATRYQSDLSAIGTAPPPAPRWDQNWFSGLDAIIAYTLVRARRPKRIVDIGSGHSTRFLAKAIADEGSDTQLVAIDPEPRTRIEGLSLTHEKRSVQQAPVSWFSELEANDFLTIDSSHILMPGTDVDFILNEVLPALPPEVLVHFHDIFLPDPYPNDWRWRGYNEQSAVATLVTSTAYRPLFASHFLASRRPEGLQGAWYTPLLEQGGAPPSSLWLQKEIM